MAQKHANPGEVIDLNTFGEDKSTALVKEKAFETIRLYLTAGKTLPEHEVEGPITVQCLEGQCTFTAAGQRAELVAGSWLYLEGGTPHAVEASEDTKLLLTIVFAKAHDHRGTPIT